MIDRAEHTYETTSEGKVQCTVCGYVLNEAISVDTDKALTLISGDTTADGYRTANSYLYYIASAAGSYDLTLTFDNNMVPYFVEISVSVNGTTVTGTDSVYTVDLVEGANYIVISYTGTGETIVLSDYTYTATLSTHVDKPTLVLGANTVTEYETYTFTSDSDGYYTFTVSETSGWAAIYSSEDSWTALLDEYGKGQTSYTTQISAGSSITLYVTNGGDGSYVITVTYSATNPDPNAVTTSVPETLAIGDNAIALSEEDGETGVSSTFTATEAGIYTFSISGDNSAYASLGKKYTISDRSLQVVYADDPQTYTLEANETITIYFYSEDDSEFTFNIVFGDTVSTDDDYLLSKTYTITTERDADYGDYRFKKTYIIKTSGTYTFTLDTTATTGTSTLYISNDGTLWDLAAELSVSGTTTSTYNLTEGNTVIIMVFDSAANDYVLTVSLAGEEAPCEHSYDEGVWTWATDYSSASVKFTCATCGDTKTVTAEVKSSTTDATCTEDGSTDYTATATFDGKEYTATKSVTTSATGHTYEAVVTAPTCTEEGYTTYTCSACGYTYKDNYVEATGHTWNSTATCIDRYCLVCEATEAASTDHTYGIDGVCTACGEGCTHNYKTEVTAPTCTTGGYTTYTCSICDYTYMADYVEATGHTEAEAVAENEIAATCTTDGSYDSVVYCSVCSEEISRDTITVPATGHNYEAVVTEPTCTEKGYTTYTCSVCSDSYVADETAATGHSYTAAWTWAEDYTSADVTLTCSCGDVRSFTSEAITSTTSGATTVYTASYEANGKTYTGTKYLFDGTIYNISSLSDSVYTGDVLFDGFVTAYTTSTSSSSVKYTRYDRSSAAALVEGQTLYEGVVLTHCIRMNGSASNERGIQFTLSEDATVFIYYATNKTLSSGYLILTGDGGTYTIASDTGLNTDIYMYKVQLTKGTYKLYAGATGAYDLYSIGVSYNTSTGTCEHTYVESWAWASDYSSATLTLTCSLCGDVQTFTVSSTSATDDEGNTVYTVTYICEGDGNTYEATETVSAEDSYFTAGTYTVEPTLNESSGDYRYSYTYTVNKTGTYTIALDTTATTGSGTLYFSLDGTLSNLAAELSTSGTTSTVCDLNAGGTITVILYGDADAYTYVFTVIYSELCDHSYTDTWDWTKNYTSYTSATVTLTCGDCGMVITATVEPTSVTADDNINYTVTYTYNGVIYTDSKTVEIKTFNGTIYDVADLSSGTYDIDEEIFEGITIIGNPVSTWSSTYPSDDLIYTDLYGNTVELTTALSIGYSKTKGISFTLKSEATIVLYYAVGSISSFYIYVDEENTAQVVTITPTATSTVMIAEFTLAAGTYSIHCSTTGITAYLYAIGISGDALYIADEDNSLLTLKNGYTWDSEAGDSGAYVYNPTEYELTSSIGTYTLTVKNSGVYVFTARTSAVTVDGTTISAGSTATFVLYADDVLSITVTDDTTLSVQYTDVTGNAYGTFDSTLYEDDPDSSYTFTNYSGGITLAAGEAVYYRIDAATQDGDGNTSFNFYIYVSGDVDNISVYYSKTVDGEANIAAKDSYTLVTLTEDGYYYITLSAKGHGYFKIVANSAATITVELNEGGEGGDDSGDSGDSGDYVAMTLGDTMTLDLLVDDNDYRVVYLSYTAAEAGSYTLTLSGSSSMWSQSSMLTAMLSSITVTVNGETVSSETGVYSLSLVEGENTIVINYKFNSSSALASTSFTALLAAA